MNNQSTNNTQDSSLDIFANSEVVTTEQIFPSSEQSNGTENQVLQNDNVEVLQSATENVVQSSDSMNQTYQNQSNVIQQDVSLQQTNLNTQVPNDMLNQNVPNSMDDESLLRCFIGENYNKITKRKFNFAACFFGNFYLFYRKMFWQGLVLYCIMLGIITLFDFSSWLVLLAIAVFWGLTFNSSYVKYAKEEIERIKQENSDANPNIISFLCVSKGGTSTGNIFLGIFITGIISTIYSMIVISGIISTM